MIKRTLYFGNPAYLSVRNEQLLLRLPDVLNAEGLPESFKKHAEHSLPIEDIGMLVIDHSQITVTHDLIEKLMANNAAVLWCDAKHLPISITLPLASNHTASEKSRYQLNASEPLKKQLWKQTIEAKISNQAAVLEYFNLEAKDLRYQAKQVGSGDPSNTEARVAVSYWKRLLSPYGVKRGQYEGSANNLLNYGYAILRATVARSLCESGLLPMLGIHHTNKYNAYCLADDIMEPYRPFVDKYVFEYLRNESIPEELTKKEKAYLLGIPALDLRIDGKSSPLMVGMQRTSSSLVRAYMGETRKILYPTL